MSVVAHPAAYGIHLPSEDQKAFQQCLVLFAPATNDIHTNLQTPNNHNSNLSNYNLSNRNLSRVKSSIVVFRTGMLRCEVS